MSKTNATARRVRVERNIYRRPTGVFEVGFKDGAGVQRWRTVAGGITAARALRDELLARRGRGERVAPNPRLRFGDAAEKWLAGPVVDLRETTRDLYRNAVENHLQPRYATRRLDTITPDDLAALIRELRDQRLAEASIAIVLGVAKRIYDYAARRLGWAGANPTMLLLSSERPKPSQAARKRLFEDVELEQVIAAARGQWRVLFILAAITGARLSELCGLTWADVRLDDLDDAEVEFGWQVDRKGNRRPTKTDGSARTVPIPRELAVILAKHKLASRNSQPDAYVFATSSGRPLSQRNVGRGLRATQRRAVDEQGAPTPSRSSTKRTTRGGLCRSRVVRFPRCTPTVTQSPAGRCSLARASMRSRSCSGTATPTSRAPSTYARLATGDGERGDAHRWWASTGVRLTLRRAAFRLTMIPRMTCDRSARSHDC
jgi:integrase